MELEWGVLGIARRDAAPGALLRSWLDLHVPDRRGERAARIAAIAPEHGMTVVTRNVGDVEDTGVTVPSPRA